MSCIHNALVQDLVAPALRFDLSGDLVAPALGNYDRVTWSREQRRGVVGRIFGQHNEEWMARELSAIYAKF